MATSWEISFAYLFHFIFGLKTSNIGFIFVRNLVATRGRINRRNRSRIGRRSTFYFVDDQNDREIFFWLCEKSIIELWIGQGREQGDASNSASRVAVSSNIRVFFMAMMVKNTRKLLWLRNFTSRDFSRRSRVGRFFGSATKSVVSFFENWVFNYCFFLKITIVSLSLCFRA